MSVLDPLYAAVSWTLQCWHHVVVATGLAAAGGAGWALSIFLLVCTIRLALVRPALRQARSQRRLAALGPELARLRRKHRGDPVALQRAVAELHRSAGVRPLAGCLPMVLQLPVFLALSHVLRHPSAALAHAKLFGAPLSASLRDGAAQLHALAGAVTAAHVVIAVVVLLSAAAAYATQRLIRAAAVAPPQGRAATVQAALRYGVPLSVVCSGAVFPLGLLLYWATSNLWTLGQQVWLMRYGGS